MRRLVVGVEGSLSSVSAICGSATCVTAYAWALALLQQELWLSALCQTALVTALGKRAPRCQPAELLPQPLTASLATRTGAARRSRRATPVASAPSVRASIAVRAVGPPRRLLRTCASGTPSQAQADDTAAQCCSSERRNAQCEGASAASAPKSHEGTRCDYLPAGDTDQAVWVIPLRKSTSGIQSLASLRGVRGFHTRYIYAGRCRR